MFDKLKARFRNFFYPEGQPAPDERTRHYTLKTAGDDDPVHEAFLREVWSRRDGVAVMAAYDEETGVLRFDDGKEIKVEDKRA